MLGEYKLLEDGIGGSRAVTALAHTLVVARTRPRRGKSSMPADRIDIDEESRDREERSEETERARGEEEE